MEEQDEILKEFVVECAEGLSRLEQDFIALEGERTNSFLIASIFRTIHTIKGTCGFLGLPKLENIAHGAENLLAMMRDGKIPVTQEGISLLLLTVDAIKEILAHLEGKGSEPDKDYDALRQRLNALLSGEPPHPTPLPLASLLTPHLPNEGSSDTTQAQEKGLTISESSIRVDVGLLDKLMNLIGELVLARNQLLQRAREREDTTFAGTVQRMNLITTELQDAVMKTRMQPIRDIWEKFPRLVRDLSLSAGNEVRLVMEGADTELDKTLLEAIKDPLTHIIRNAMDHGIEVPEIRSKRGKEAYGTLSLKAYHEGGQINIEIRDDGNGIDLEKVKHKAAEKGLISAEGASRLSEREVLNLVFLPGLSTAEKVTNVSGRGVGMDVVKSNIERIGGTVELTSHLEEGTSLRIKIPLTLAIIPALMVSSGSEFFAIPQASLLELVRLDKEAGERIEMIHGAPFYRLRGLLLPLLYLSRVLCLEENNPPQSPSLTPPSPSLVKRGIRGGVEGEGGVRLGGVGDKGELSDTNIVVLKAGDRSFGLMVETVNESEEIVVKPLSRHLKDLSVYAGATIMGDGRVALILDVGGIAKIGGILQNAAEGAGLKGERETEEIPLAEHQTFLVFSVSGCDRFAIPLALVARLEEIAPDKIEKTSGGEVIQYRGTLLPLIYLNRALGVDALPGNGSCLPVIVFSEGKKNVGIVVGQILDIVDEHVVLYPSSLKKREISGSVVVQGRTTDLLNVYQIIEDMIPGWLKTQVREHIK